MKKRYLVTAALPYANGPLHIGHLAGAYLPADIYVRYLRLMGKDVVFVCGSDEHGAAITVKARKEGTTPRAIVDKYHEMLKDTFEKIGIAFDIYHRTSAQVHHETSQDFFRKLYEKEEFIEETTEQYFDETAGQFLADRYITGTCPVCDNPEAYGDQCERCGSTLSPTDLINPKSMLSGSVPVKRPTKHWFLRLDKHENWLREWINTGKADGRQLHDPAAWKNHVLGQCNSWLDQGLQPRAMTRDLDWGVDVPHEIPGSEGKKLYVWLDAPIGYISATKQWASDNRKKWEPYWKNDDTALIHFIGKDNIVFHCLIFPAILKAHGEFILPVNVPANQFLNLEGRKLSTSKNWAVWVHEYCEEFKGQEDVLRYNMIKKMPEQSDSEFTWKGFQETNNNELVNNLGNFIQRALVLTHKYYSGVVPAINSDLTFKSGWDAERTGQYNEDLALLHKKLEEMGVEIQRFNFREALQTAMEIAGAGNALLQFNEPWKTEKDDPETVKVVLNLSLQHVAALSIAIRPFLPFSAEKLRTMLNLPPLRDDGELLDVLNELVEGNPIVQPNHALGQPAHLFSRIADEVIQKQVEKLVGAPPAPPGGGEGVVHSSSQDKESKKTIETLPLDAKGAPPAPPGGGEDVVHSSSQDKESKKTIETLPLNARGATPSPPPGGPGGAPPNAQPSTINYLPLKETIQFDDFVKLDIRTGTIRRAEKMEKSKKLLKLDVDLGFETRTILSGIAEQFSPEEVTGRQVVVLINLAPRLMMGVESQGMILLAEDAQGKLSFVSPADGWPDGMGVR